VKVRQGNDNTNVAVQVEEAGGGSRKAGQSAGSLRYAAATAVAVATAAVAAAVAVAVAALMRAVRSFQPT
jgi:hypothetical protein